MNNILPIAAYRNQIIDTIRNNEVTIIRAETGAGKSTQVPRFLHEAGYRVIATQPRRMAARTLAERVAAEQGSELGGTVGYRTALDKFASAETEILFCTDGLQLVRQLTGRVETNTVLIVDEVHVWNRNIEALVAWCLLQLRHGASFKLVVMSATLESGLLSRYFGDAPVISVPGRSFPVEQRHSYDDPLEVAAKYIRAGQKSCCSYQASPKSSARSTRWKTRASKRWPSSSRCTGAWVW